MRRIGKILLVTLATGCSPPSPGTAPGAPATTEAKATSTAREGASTPERDGGAPPAPSANASAERPAITGAEAERLLFVAEAAAPGKPRLEPAVGARAACPAGVSDSERVRCLLKLRFRDAGDAADEVLALFDRTGDVVGLEQEHTMNGGFRGTIKIVPEAPIGAHRRHLTWLATATKDFDAFFAWLAADAPAPIRYRWTALAFKFFRSVNRTTPSAYAEDWSIAYNVSGSLHGSADAVRETLFHEVFHLNDSGHAGWSRRALGRLYDDIVAKCGTKVACLGPYAPNDTMVRGGTYYAFQPENGDGVNEYAAELAIRYYREHRAILRREALGRRPFKCGPDPNAQAWSLFVNEFFGGVDKVPPC